MRQRTTRRMRLANGTEVDVVVFVEVPPPDSHVENLAEPIAQTEAAAAQSAAQNYADSGDATVAGLIPTQEQIETIAEDISTPIAAAGDAAVEAQIPTQSEIQSLAQTEAAALDDVVEELIPTEAEIGAIAVNATGMDGGELVADTLPFNDGEASLSYSSLVGFVFSDPASPNPGRLTLGQLAVVVLTLAGLTVSFGANDSGGSGKRALVVDNA